MTISYATQNVFIDPRYTRWCCPRMSRLWPWRCLAAGAHGWCITECCVLVMLHVRTCMLMCKCVCVCVCMHACTGTSARGA